MKLAIISDLHVLGPSELAFHESSLASLSEALPQHQTVWRRFLHSLRQRLWLDQPEARHDIFIKTLEAIGGQNPDYLIANGDYGGDTGGIGLSCEHTFESAATAITRIRETFPDKCQFVFGDHDIGKYSTTFREGGIRLKSLTLGQERLGIESFWEKPIGAFHGVGVNSSLLTLDLFLPEALDHEIPAWKRLREEHIDHIRSAFARIDTSARIILFCHDPSALSKLQNLPEVKQRIDQIELTILGHYHNPRLLSLAKRMPRLPNVHLKYPVARIMMQGLKDTRFWKDFNPAVCPSTFGTGKHLSGGFLFIETNEQGQLVTQRHRVAA